MRYDNKPFIYFATYGIINCGISRSGKPIKFTPYKRKSPAPLAHTPIEEFIDSKDNIIIHRRDNNRDTFEIRDINYKLRKMCFYETISGVSTRLVITYSSASDFQKIFKIKQYKSKGLCTSEYIVHVSETGDVTDELRLRMTRSYTKLLQGTEFGVISIFSWPYAHVRPRGPRVFKSNGGMAVGQSSETEYLTAMYIYLQTELLV